MSQYITTNYQCHKCQKLYEFSDNKNLQGIRQYQCKHYILKFIKNMDNNFISYKVCIKCRKCLKIKMLQLFIFNNKSMIDFNSTIYKCCNNQINFAAFYSDVRSESINKMQQNNLDMSYEYFNMNMFENETDNTYIRSNSDNLTMNNLNNQMNNINLNNNNFNRGFSENIQNNNFMNNFNNNNQINNNNNNNFQNNNVKLMAGPNMNGFMNNMNNQNKQFPNMNIIQNPQFNNNMNNQNNQFPNMNMNQNTQFNNNNMNNFQNNNNMNIINNNMNNNNPQFSSDNSVFVGGQKYNFYYINGNQEYLGQQISFKFEFKQQYYYISTTNNRIFNDVLSEFLNVHPEINALLTYNQKYLFNGDVIDINKTLYELQIKNESVVIIYWVDNN